MKPGDLVVVGGYGVHVETVRGFDGSLDADLRRQHLARQRAARSRTAAAPTSAPATPGEVRGYALVRYPGE